MDPELFIKTFPQLYHMAHHEALPSIRRHGLLSTSALLDLFGKIGPEREEIEMKMRPECVVITHPTHGKAVVRDQKPIGSDKRLAQALGGSISTADFHRLLNSMVFFWVSPDRLETLRNAVAYRDTPQLVLILDTKRVVEACVDDMILCPMNSGSCRPMAHPRTSEIFQPIHDYDFNFWRMKKGAARKAVVECTIKKGVLDVNRFILKTEIVGRER